MLDQQSGCCVCPIGQVGLWVEACVEGRAVARVFKQGISTSATDLFQQPGQIVFLVLLQNPSTANFTPSNHPPRKSKRPIGEKVSLPI